MSGSRCYRPPFCVVVLFAWKVLGTKLILEPLFIIPGKGPFDLCLFSESFQYIPLDAGVPRCLGLLTAEGEIIISDCFRSEGFGIEKGKAYGWTTSGFGYGIAEIN